ncbi:MAG: immunity 53 family protein [Phycisphaeraceae bacterium]|nr:immunity 53 family protein [Phycisphaeraceae bacterium]
MSSDQQSVLSRLQKWYHSHCNDEWEHAYGIKIGTLDNPGWWITISLTETQLAGRPFEKIIDGEEDSNYDDEGNQIGPWMDCWVHDDKFEAACGPNDLERCLRTFLDWADGTRSR